MTDILTHRGLDPSQKDYFLESSYEAFVDQITRGFGLEFDVQFTRDHGIIISHDADLKRISGGRDTRNISDVTTQEIADLAFNHCHLATLAQLFGAIREHGGDTHYGIHLKYRWQSETYLALLLKELETVGFDAQRFFIFDVMPEAARFLKKYNPHLKLAPSVAHAFDIERYNQFVHTLISVKEALANRKLFDWAWLDEWDRTGPDDMDKTLYTQEIIDTMRNAGLHTAIVSPELHATSPVLAGGEAHPDARDLTVLEKRLREIVSYRPDVICTDYPDNVHALVQQKNEISKL